MIVLRKYFDDDDDTSLNCRAYPENDYGRRSCTTYTRNPRGRIIVIKNGWPPPPLKEEVCVPFKEVLRQKKNRLFPGRVGWLTEVRRRGRG